jgi:hypothetical protein
MNILMSVLLYIAPQPILDCGHGLPAGESFVPLALTAPATGLAQARPMANRYFNTAPSAADDPGAQSLSSDADLLFYLDSHAHALSDSGASMDPWVQLQPVGSVEGFPVSEAPVGSAGGQPTGHHGKGRLPGGGNACS